MSVLDAIVERKREEVRRQKVRLPESFLDRLIRELPKPRGFKAAVSCADRPNVIAEIKRASPSKGVLRPDQKPLEWDPVGIARAYEANGAVALSILTDTVHFWGTPDLLGACREAVSLPLLRKEFIIDPYQVSESRWLGADAILLIARCLSAKELEALAAQAVFLGMDVLIEVHHREELEKALAVPEAMIGINHRDLSTLEMFPERAIELRKEIPDTRVVVGESGIRCSADIFRLQEAGVNVFLVGSHLVAGGNPGGALAELFGGAS